MDILWIYWWSSIFNTPRCLLHFQCFSQCINLYGQLRQQSVNCEHRCSQLTLYWCSRQYRFIHRVSYSAAFLASPTGTNNDNWFRNPFCFLCDLFDGVDDDTKYTAAVETECDVNVRSTTSYGDLLKLHSEFTDDPPELYTAEKRCGEDRVYDVIHVSVNTSLPPVGCR